MDHTGPYGIMRYHTGPYSTIWDQSDHTGQNWTIQDHSGPYGTLRDHIGSYWNIVSVLTKFGYKTCPYCKQMSALQQLMIIVVSINLDYLYPPPSEIVLIQLSIYKQCCLFACRKEVDILREVGAETVLRGKVPCSTIQCHIVLYSTLLCQLIKSIFIYNESSNMSLVI